ncbi:hypothetical protein ACFE04_007600 [Oxalis oulophora]
MGFEDPDNGLIRLHSDDSSRRLGDDVEGSKENEVLATEKDKIVETENVRGKQTEFGSEDDASSEEELDDWDRTEGLEGLSDGDDDVELQQARKKLMHQKATRKRSGIEGLADALRDLHGEEDEKLKYLEFVHIAVLHAVLCFTNLYVKAKEKSGPLKSGVETVEGTVKSVVGPVYDKYHDVPIEILKFVDRKVDESVNGLDRKVPPVLKQVSAQAFSAAQKAPEVARGVASEVQTTGVVSTASGIAKSVYAKYEPTAKELYNKYEPKAELCAVSAWRKLNKLPLFPQVADVVLPTAAYCSEKYNQTVTSSAEKGYRVSSYLPLVPTKRIAKVFGDVKPESQPLVAN